MPVDIGRTLKRRREWARLTQAELVEQARLDRSPSYLGAIENGRTSPTLQELEQLARYFRLSVLELIQEAMEDAERRPRAPEPEPDVSGDAVLRRFDALSDENRRLAEGFLDLLLRHQRAG